MDINEELEDLRREVNSSADKAIAKIDLSRGELLDKIDQVRTNEVVRLISGLDNRFDAMDDRLRKIEARLPEEEEP